MKAPKFISPFKLIGLSFFLIGIVLSLQSCLTLLSINQDAKPTIEHDDIKGVTRYKSILYYHFAVENNSSFSSSEQHIIKEIKGLQNEYKIYDYIQLDPRINYIEDTIYFIVDGKAHPIQISSQQSERHSEIYKDEEEIILADSSKTTVIRDYEILNYTNLSIQYYLNKELINKIANAEEAKIRYYAPPEMITLKLSNLKLKSFKELANSKYVSENNKSKYIFD
jgi:hypothetical protein